MLFANVISFAACLSAGESRLETVAAFREQGKFAEAFAELDRWEKSDDISAEDAAIIVYERSVTLLFQSRTAPSGTTRYAMLREAANKLEMLIGGELSSAMAFEAREQLCIIYIEIARLAIGGSRHHKEDEKREQTVRAGLAYYDQAAKLLAALGERQRVSLSKFPVAVAAEDVERLAQRDKLRADHIKTQMQRAVVMFERGEATPDPAARTAALRDAAAAYRDLYEKYRRRLAGLYARLQEGRCYESLGELPTASEIYDELLAETPQELEPLRVLRTKTLVRAVLCWSDEKVGNAEKAIEAGQSWLEQQRPVERSDADWLELRLSLARAHQRHAANQAAESDASKAALRAAVEEAQAVAGVESPHRTNAEALVNELTGMSPPKGP